MCEVKTVIHGPKIVIQGVVLSIKFDLISIKYNLTSIKFDLTSIKFDFFFPYRFTVATFLTLRSDTMLTTSLYGSL